MKRILVTGGAGFIGSSICMKLREKYPGYKIMAFDNLRRRGSELNLQDFKKMDIGFMHGDIRNKEDMDAVPEFDILVEASAEPSVLSGIDSDPSYIINNNLNGAIHCFNACLKNKARLIFLSTSRVYPVDVIENAEYVEEAMRYNFSPDQQQPGISKKGISEQLSLEGYRSFYGATKLASEMFIKEYAQFYGLQAAVTRFGVIAGPRQMGKSDQGIATLWMAKHYWKQPLKYIGYGGTGKQVRDILHVDDAVALVDMQIHQPEKFDGKVFNAGGGLISSASLMEMTGLCETISGNKISITPDTGQRPADLRIYITDNTKIENETGWKPVKKMNDIFSDIYSWISRNEKQLDAILK